MISSVIKGTETCIGTTQALGGNVVHESIDRSGSAPESQRELARLQETPARSGAMDCDIPGVIREVEETALPAYPALLQRKATY
jgi:hypothetical protein